MNHGGSTVDTELRGGNHDFHLFTGRSPMKVYKAFAAAGIDKGEMIIYGLYQTRIQGSAWDA